VLVGEDYAAQAYERRVRRIAEELGCRYVSEQLAADVEEADALALVGKLNADPRVHGWLGLARGATVVSCHRFTAQAGRLKEHTSRADILVVAAGVPKLVTGAMVKEGVIAVDVGINPVKDEQTGKVRLVGDLDFESVAERAEAITPVPGGVGPITDVWLLRNTAEAASLQG
jgi:methylenetetrahydrofolate dehydrogenase (NADP+) / methenyltetrahydrofolate cyclohydrolase